jgi:hypothetical protein
MGCQEIVWVMQTIDVARDKYKWALMNAGMNIMVL